MNTKPLVITTVTTGQNASKSLVWDGHEPLLIGHPFRWSLEKTDKGALIRQLNLGNAKTTAVSNAKIEAGVELLLDSPQTKHKIKLLIRPTRKWDEKSSALPNALDDLQSDPNTFKNALIASSAVLIAIILMSWFWPKTKPTEELIPEQFTKIVMTTPKKQEPSGGGPSGSSSKTPKKAQDAEVVRAFRAKALQTAISGLLKGGMTKLLAQSDFVAGTNATAATSGLFKAKGQALRATAAFTGPIDGKSVTVAGLGGDGGGPGGAGVGYGKGKHAGVSGQGQGFVSMDLGNTTVEEGLTKDEVGAVIHSHLSEVRYCYESAMIRTPDIEGKLIIDFTIGGTGIVKSSAVKSSTLPDARLDDCIIRRLGTWKFPQPKGGIDVAVTYPFIFKTLGR